MSELFTFNQEHFQNNLRDLPYELRFQMVEGLTDQEKFELAISWKTPEPNSTFHKIELDGMHPIYLITDMLDSNPNLEFNPESLSVFGMWHDEQFITHTFSQAIVMETIKKAVAKNGKVTTLDIGSGSGISAIIMQRYTESLEIPNYQNTGIDLNARAIDFGRRNISLNNLQAIDWKNEVYNIDSAALKSSNIIHLNSPYNPRPKELAKFSTRFADGWSEDGTLNFKNQVSLAYKHLAANGIMVINMMSPDAIGNANKPLSVEYIQSIDPTMSIEVLEIYEPFSAGEFLEASFADLLQDIRTADPKKVKQFNQFKDKISAKNNRFHYNVLVVKNDGKGDYKVHKSSEHNLAIYDPRCRQENHRGINIGSVRRMMREL
jgi:SAM-dependent methyltransferase